MKLDFAEAKIELTRGEKVFLGVILLNAFLLLMICFLFFQSDLNGVQSSQKRFNAPTEIELGSFNYMTHDSEATDGKSVQVFEFDASVILAKDGPGEKDFVNSLYQYQARIEQMVEEVIRSSDKGDFNQPGLDKIRSRMTDGINEITGEKMIDNLQFSHFRHFRARPKTSLKRPNWELRQQQTLNR